MLIGVGGVGGQPRLHGQDPAVALEESLAKVVESAEPAVVSIARFKPLPHDRNEPSHKVFGQIPRGRQSDEADEIPNDFGVGCLVSPAKSLDRFVLTNLHVVRGGPVYPQYEAEDGTQLRVKLYDRRACYGALIAADPRSDLAVLRLDWDRAGMKSADFPTLNWEAATPPRKGQFVVLLGNPYAIARDGSASVSWGIVSNLTRQPITLNRNQGSDLEEYINSSSLYRLGSVMQLDARLNLGTSGGPVLNLKGELIGISTALAAVGGVRAIGRICDSDRWTHAADHSHAAGGAGSRIRHDGCRTRGHAG